MYNISILFWFEHFSTSNVKIKTYHKLKIFLRRIRFSFLPHIITSCFCKVKPSNGYFEKLCVPRSLQGNLRSINTTTSKISSQHQWKKFSFLSVSLTLFNLEICKNIISYVSRTININGSIYIAFIELLWLTLIFADGESVFIP